MRDIELELFTKRNMQNQREEAERRRLPEDEQTIKMQIAFNRCRTKGIPLKEADFLPEESRRAIAGLVLAHNNRDDRPLTFARTLNRKTSIFLGREIVDSDDFTDGWLVSYPKTEEVSPSKRVDTTKSFIISPDFTIYTAATKTNFDPLDYFVEDDVTESLLRDQLNWVEPGPETYSRVSVSA